MYLGDDVLDKVKLSGIILFLRVRYRLLQCHRPAFFPGFRESFLAQRQASLPNLLVDDHRAQAGNRIQQNRLPFEPPIGSFRFSGVSLPKIRNRKNVTKIVSHQPQ